MNDRQIECFIKVVERESFSQAAKDLFISQPNVTYHIKELEKELKIPLLYRDHSSIILTEAGKEFYENAIHIMEAFDAAKYAMSCYQKQQQYTIGFPGIMVQYHTEAYHAIMKKLSVSMPEYRFKASIIDGEDKTNALLRQQADVVICHVDQPVRKNIQVEHLTYLTPYILMSRSHPLASHDHLTLSDLTTYPLYIAENDTSFSLTVLSSICKIQITESVPSNEYSFPLIELHNGILLSSVKLNSSNEFILKKLYDFGKYEIAVCYFKDTDKVLDDIASIILEIEMKYLEAVGELH